MSRVDSGDGRRSTIGDRGIYESIDERMQGGKVSRNPSFVLRNGRAISQQAPVE